MKGNVLEIPGSFLEPGFSIYLFEIQSESEKFFYIGMTGDNYYPSARSAIYRLSGHFEKHSRSTQNQLRKALNEKINIADFSKITIKMHHFPIAGYESCFHLLKTFTKRLTQKRKYKAYKEIQKKVLNLENKLIFDFKNINLLNNTPGKNCDGLEPEYVEIYKEVANILKG
jgi:hypothetical protein